MCRLRCSPRWKHFLQLSTLHTYIRTSFVSVSLILLMAVPSWMGTLRPRLFFVRLGTGRGSTTRDLGPRRSDGVFGVEAVVEDEDSGINENWVMLGMGTVKSGCKLDTSDALHMDVGPDKFGSGGESESKSSEGVLADDLRFFRGSDLALWTTAAGGLSSLRRRFGTYPV